MARIRDKSGTYAGIGTAPASSDSSSDSLDGVAPGIGTRIALSADALGTRKSAATCMGISPDALQRYIREENTPSFAVMAKLAAASGRSLEWLATGLEAAQPSASQHVSHDRLTIGLELTDKVLEGRWVPRANYAQVLSVMLEALSEGRPYEEILTTGRGAVRALLKGGRGGTASTVDSPPTGGGDGTASATRGGSQRGKRGPA